MMESEEAIMENENNCNLESESINRERGEEAPQDAAHCPGMSPSTSEAHTMKSDGLLNTENDSPTVSKVVLSCENAESVSQTRSRESITEVDQSTRDSPLTEPDIINTDSHATNIQGDESQEASTGALSNGGDDSESREVPLSDHHGEPMEVMDKVEDRTDSCDNNDNGISNIPNVHPSQTGLSGSTVALVSSVDEKVDDGVSADLNISEIQGNDAAVNSSTNANPESNTPDFSHFVSEKNDSSSPQQDGDEIQQGRDDLMKNDTIQCDAEDVDLIEQFSPQSQPEFALDNQNNHQATESILPGNENKEEFRRCTTEGYEESADVSEDGSLNVTQCGSNEEGSLCQLQTAKMDSESGSGKEDVVMTSINTQEVDVKSPSAQSVTSQSDVNKELAVPSNLCQVVESNACVISHGVDTDNNRNLATEKSEGRSEIDQERSYTKHNDSENISIEQESVEKSMEVDDIVSNYADNTDFREEETSGYCKEIEENYDGSVNEGRTTSEITGEESLTHDKDIENLSSTSSGNQIISSQSEKSPSNRDKNPDEDDKNLDCNVTKAAEAVQTHSGNAILSDDMMGRTLPKVLSIENDMNSGTDTETGAEKLLEPDTDSLRASDNLNETPVKSIDMDEKPVKSIDMDETPVKSIDMDEIPVKSIDRNEAPVKSIDMDETPVKSIDMDETLAERMETGTDENSEIAFDKTVEGNGTENLNKTPAETVVEPLADKIFEGRTNESTLATVEETTVKRMEVKVAPADTNESVADTNNETASIAETQSKRIDPGPETTADIEETGNETSVPENEPSSVNETSSIAEIQSKKKDCGPETTADMAEAENERTAAEDEPSSVATANAIPNTMDTSENASNISLKDAPQAKSAQDSSSDQSSKEKTNETRPLIEAKNIKQELLEDGTSNKETTDADVLRTIKMEIGEADRSDGGNESEDVVVLDDDGESFPVKKEPGTAADSSLVISSVSGQQHTLHEQAANVENIPNKTTVESGKGNTPKKSKSKAQTCIVCLKTCRCKYNIVRNGDIKHLCGDDCFKRFRKTPSAFLKNKESKPPEPPRTDTSTVNRTQGLQETLPKFKTCSVCQLMNVNPNQPFLNWKGLDFCGESCLGKFQTNLSSNCSYCRAFIAPEKRATFCLKIGNDMRPFCKQRCIAEFKKNLRLCACCQKDLSVVPGCFSAMVGSLDKKIRQFCSQACHQRLEAQLVGVEVVSKLGETSQNSSITQASASLPPGTDSAVCSVCQKMQHVKHTVRFQGKVHHLCSNLCLSAFQYTNKIGMSKCDSCGTVCTVEEAQAHFVQFEGQIKRFCSDACVNSFRRDNSKVVSCCWCGTKKMNFDMIERLDAENKFQMFCSLNCLSLYRVNLQAKSNQAVACDQCKTVTPAQYHLTMSDASVRNFCCYTCVMTFQSQFTSKPLPPAPSLLAGSVTAPQKQLPAPIQPKEPVKPVQSQPASKGRGRMNTRNAAKQLSPSFPVISNVVSLAPPPGQQNEPPPPASPLPSQQAPKTSGSNTLSSGDGKHQILIQAPPVKVMRNKSLQCRPVTLTKATSCRPHSQAKEIQTEKIPDKQVMIPIPVPIYIPMPTVMYSVPTPVPVPFPIPIPVPVFIPTTRKSAAGILKTITDIVERMPSDPLEAELLMMAEAVASDKKESDSESEPEADFGAGFDDEPDESVPVNQKENEASSAKKKDGQGEEDMIQMALRMAEEMSAPVEDLESSVEPVAVNTDPPSNVHTTQPSVYQADEDYVPPGSRGRGRGAKRTRTRTPNSRAKRQRVERNFAEENNSQPHTVTPQPANPQQVMEPAADANYRLKFTYGVNAWRHWVIAKNAQIESSKTTNSYRVRTFPTDILKCTTDELNFSLIFFIKEVRKPNGEEYSPDSIYYLCLGIQQYLYENGRIDSIFTDNYFEKFADSLHEILKNLQPKVNSQGQMLCRIEEEHLWESKQLGAHSPFVLLNTLIYFHTKHFILKTAQEHMSLSFAQILKHWKKGVPLKGQASTGKNISLRFYCLANGKKDNLAARKSKEGVPVYEITENFENPLRCPVKLYEFFLSKCPESIKNRNDIFYPVPERSCVPDSPVWYSTQSIGLHTMDKMLTRVLLVREIQESHLHAQPIYL